MSAGSGAGAELTALAESLQAYACATRQFLGKDLDHVSQITKHTIADAHCNRDLDACIKGLDEDWYYSVIVTANQIYRDVPKAKSQKYHFSRGEEEEEIIYAAFRKFKKVSGITGEDKWNPADIWMIKKGFKIDTNHPTLKDLNRYMYDQFAEGNLIGISLKKVPQKYKVHSRVYNSDKPIVASFTGFRPGHQMFDSKDIYIEFESEKKPGEIQLRTFSSRPTPSAWQGEIKGKTAAGGKIGGGLVMRAAIESGISQSQLITPQQFTSQILKPQLKYTQKFATMFKELSGSRDNIKKLIEETEHYQRIDPTWWLTKFIGVNYCYTIMKYKKENDVTKWLFEYGSSQTKNSSIFIKYST